MVHELSSSLPQLAQPNSMSSPKEVENQNTPIVVADESLSVDLQEEKDAADAPTIEEEVNFSKSGRKRKSKVWNAFVEVEVKEKGKLVQKLECLYCKTRYKHVDGGPTSTLKRHLNSCPAFKKSKGKSQAHYVDADWRLQKRIISFIDLAPPHSGEVISDGIIECVMKWGIQDKIGTITLDNASSNDKAADILKSNFLERGKLQFEGLFFHVRCCAHILNLVVQDGLKVIDGCLVKIREGVKYFRKSPGRLLKFGEIAISLGIKTRRSLCTDVKTRWNSTHRMLESALYYKSAFHHYASRDPNFAWELEPEQWASASKVCNFLEVFLGATNIFSGTMYPTANLLLVEIFNVKKEICEAYQSSDAFLREMSEPMFEKFDKYWGEVGVLMSIASILDPRFKLASVEYAFKELYPVYEVDKRVKDVTNKLRALYDKYAKDRVASKAAATTSSMTAASAPAESSSRSRKKEDFMAFVKARGGEKSTKTELEVYLEEPVFNEEEQDKGQFDILLWWSQNCSKFPTLSKLARDVLCIPITTVASESAFSAGGRILDDYRSSLTSDMVELLICGGDWIRASSKYSVLTLLQSAKEEENLEILVPVSNLVIS
ncbi:hypothetical protein LUZ63_008734 [Rhynchospora breviuscula]|uniref:BED-type domain-containing protein n=1 Tax=Rhynchospora breviuscula TaxID=2022672 RepID=A0A9Q0HMU0_9POAL|nr:hypothetical protein LUZ63_008734 [Rhynchospora breviuscula]